jgi:hypothetical protein
LTGLTTKAHTLSATYSGDANYAAGGPISETITVVAASVKKSATVALKTASATANSCQTLSFSAQVLGESDKAPTGTVKLIDGSRVLATATLNQGKTVFSLSPMTGGTHALKAVYSGDQTYSEEISKEWDESVKTQSICAAPKAGPVRLARNPGIL